MATTVETLMALESGDRLTREEFHRRDGAHPDVRKAELVEGVVYVTSPVRGRRHAKPNGCIVYWLGAYCRLHLDLEFGTDATVRLDARNEVQPDAYLFREVPGGPAYSADDYIQGGPQLVAEIAASTASYDLHDKKEAYRRNGVREYIVWRVLDGAIDWFRLEGGEYTRVEPDASGVIESSVFPGLRLHVARMLAGDLAGVLAGIR